jgi:hypothetical protein
MENIKQVRNIFFQTIFFLFAFQCSLFGYINVDELSKKNSNSGQSTGLKSRAANCAPATHSTVMEFNNVRATIHTGGDMWWDFIRARYEVPINSNRHSLFAGALWMGGLDANQQLKIAALRFRQGNDYWTGPLTVDGKAES